MSDELLLFLLLFTSFHLVSRWPSIYTRPVLSNPLAGCVCLAFLLSALLCGFMKASAFFFLRRSTPWTGQMMIL